MLLKNRIFLDRLSKVGPISGPDAVGLGWTGPCLRATGVAYDIRKAHPYLKYDEVDFDVPVGTNGDTLDRFLVRLEEIRQSKRIIEQSLDRMADEGPVNCDDPRFVLPDKGDVYTTIEATIQHFKLVMVGAKVPKGEKVLLMYRGGQRRARVLHRERRNRHALPRADSPAVFPSRGRPFEASRGPDA